MASTFNFIEFFFSVSSLQFVCQFDRISLVQATCWLSTLKTFTLIECLARQDTAGTSRCLTVETEIQVAQHQHLVWQSFALTSHFLDLASAQSLKAVGANFTSGHSSCPDLWREWVAMPNNNHRLNPSDGWKAERSLWAFSSKCISIYTWSIGEFRLLACSDWPISRF